MAREHIQPVSLDKSVKAPWLKGSGAKSSQKKIGRLFLNNSLRDCRGKTMDKTGLPTVFPQQHRADFC